MKWKWLLWNSSHLLTLIIEKKCDKVVEIKYTLQQQEIKELAILKIK